MVIAAILTVVAAIFTHSLAKAMSKPAPKPETSECLSCSHPYRKVA